MWAGTRACPPALQALAGTVTKAVHTLGFVEEDRAYVPHVTLVRNAKRAPKDIVFSNISWPVRDFALIESVPAGGKSRYEIVARWAL